MDKFLILTKRNISVYIRDKGAVFFSLLSMLIVICLMVFFLGDMNIDAITRLLAEFPGRDAVKDKENAELLVLSWTSAGIVSINAVTVTLAVYSGMIKDRVNGKLNSIYTAPISRITIACAYVAAAWMASVIMCTLTLVITEVYGIMQGMTAYSVAKHVELLGLIMVNSFVFAALMYPLTMIAKTEGAWSGFGTVVGTLVGFLGGIYIPIGGLSDSIGTLMKCTPVIYGSSMFRSVMSETIIEDTFVGVPQDVVSVYRAEMGIDITVFERLLTVRDEWIILLVCGIMFLAISAIMLRYSKKSDR